MNVIIIAVIALLVLVVIAFIFTGKSRSFAKGVASCESKGGECVGAGDTCSGPVLGYTPDLNCDNNGNGEPNEGPVDGEKCCLKL